MTTTCYAALPTFPKGISVCMLYVCVSVYYMHTPGLNCTTTLLRCTFQSACLPVMKELWT